MSDSINQINPLDRTPGEYIEGFSDRFIEFLDNINFPSKARYTKGADLCSVSVNGFRRWCLLDVAPRTFTKLEEVIELFLQHQDMTNFKTKKIMAWLYFGDERDNPFPDIAGKSDDIESKAKHDFQGFWSWLFFFALTNHNVNLNLLAPRYRERLMRDIKSMAAEKFGIKLTSNNFNIIVSAEKMSPFREKLGEAIMLSLSR